jgi:transposase
LWFSPSAIKSWVPKSSGKQGGQKKYSDVAIETVLTLRLLFHLPLRQVEGFVSSLLQLMGLNLPTPDHTTLSRRARTLNIRIKRRTSNKPLHLIVDSTGLSIHGEGPWATGKKRRRGWRKLHIMIDRDGFIHSTCVSKWYTKDGSRVPHLLEDIEDEISSLTGDKGYDQSSVYKAVLRDNNDANIIIHPRANAVVSEKRKWTKRDKHVQKIFEEGIHVWRRESGYYQQSRVENTFYRYKTILGKKLRSRREDNRHVETVIGCNILNQFLELGRCTSEMVL